MKVGEFIAARVADDIVIIFHVSSKKSFRRLSAQTVPTTACEHGLADFFTLGDASLERKSAISTIHRGRLIPQAAIGSVSEFTERSKPCFIAVTGKADILQQASMDSQIDEKST